MGTQNRNKKKLIEKQNTIDTAKTGSNKKNNTDTTMVNDCHSWA